MATATRLRTKLQMLLQIESSGFALGLAILFVLMSLALPFWSISRTSPRAPYSPSSSPLRAIPGAATTGGGPFPRGGFGGRAQPAPGGPWSWGPGLGWWLLLVGVATGVSGGVLPYLKSLRSMVPS